MPAKEAVLVHRASGEHCEGLFSLLSKRPVESARWAVSAELLEQRLERFNERFDSLVLVALSEGMPVGLLTAIACTPLTEPSPRAHVFELLIDPDADTVAIEDKLIGRAIEEAKEMGCSGLALAEPSDVEAVKRLHEIGFVQQRTFLQLEF